MEGCEVERQGALRAEEKWGDPGGEQSWGTLLEGVLGLRAPVGWGLGESQR